MKPIKWMTWFKFSAFGPGFFPGTPSDPMAFNLVCAVNGVKVDLGEKVTK